MTAIHNPPATEYDASRRFSPMSNHSTTISKMVSLPYFLQHQTEGIKQVQSFGKLTYDWNGNYAEPFSANLLKRVENILKQIPNNYKLDINPTANDSIQLELYNNKKDYLEFEIFEDSINMFIKHKNSPHGKDEAVSENQILSKIVEFYAL